MSDLLHREARRSARTSGRRRVERGPRPAGNGLTPDQSRALAAVAFKIPGLVVVIAATLVLLTLVSVNSDLTGTFGAIAGLWFAVHLVPLTISGTVLGVAPLLPTVLLMWSVARGVHRVVDRDTDRRMLWWIFGASLAGPVAFTAIALAVAKDAASVIGLESPSAPIAFAWVLAVHAAASGTGIALARWDSLLMREGIPDWIRALVAPLVRVVAALVGGGALVILAALFLSWSTVGELIESGGDVVGMLGLTVVSVLYLPNVLIGTLAVATGSTASIGDASASLFATTGGPLPPLPVLAVFPDSPAQTIWVVMLAVPVGAAILLGRDCALRSRDVQVAVSSVWVVAAALGVLAAVFGFAAGGNLGTFGTVELNVWTFALLTFAWLAVVGSVSAAFIVWRRPDPDPEPDSDPIPVPPAAELQLESAEDTSQAEPTDSANVEAEPTDSAIVEAEPVDSESAEADPADSEPVAVTAEPVADGVVEVPPVSQGDDEEPLDVEVVAPPEVTAPAEGEDESAGSAESDGPAR